MKYLLDTDILVYFLNGHAKVVDAFSHVSEEDLSISIITHSELLYGAYNSQRVEKNLKRLEALFDSIRVLDYDLKSSTIFGQEKARLRKAGQPLMDLDLMIAAVAKRYKLILVTNNHKHFERIQGLKLENWLNVH